jgi:hypothetical protein
LGLDRRNGKIGAIEDIKILENVSKRLASAYTNIDESNIG